MPNGLASHWKNKEVQPRLWLPVGARLRASLPAARQLQRQLARERRRRAGPAYTQRRAHRADAEQPRAARRADAGARERGLALEDVPTGGQDRAPHVQHGHLARGLPEREHAARARAEPVAQPHPAAQAQEHALGQLRSAVDEQPLIAKANVTSRTNASAAVAELRDGTELAGRSVGNG
ncbi:hypothetical protein ON010_g11049 [Phytophthora cinnamomi]|nr:hypothetical protein ON010_g11049 [Phytophthora cinnamomi]